jgi:predicted ATPase
MIIENYRHRNKIIEFVNTRELTHHENIFTIIVGKNGTGKSSLLNTIVRQFLGESQRRFYRDMELGFQRSYWNGEILSNSYPNQIIAVSTSPFDKFPISRRYNEVSNYTYLGLRDLMSANFGVAYMSKIFASLVQSVIYRNTQAVDFGSVLDYLGYRENIHANLSLNSSKRILSDIIESKNPEEFINTTRYTPLRNFNRKFFYHENEEIDYSKVEHIRHLAHKIIENNIGIECNMVISGNGFRLDHGYELLEDDILFLIQSGFLRLRNIGLESKDTGEIFSIKDASSGEQSVILSILGIASKIQDNSLICIDEPEVCLHPEWQEKYIQILIATFSCYKDCHFIIATHSPQIIAKLSPTNCFITSIEDCNLVNAERLINKSIDFQLAYVFNTPGYKNEYLSRIALNIFTKVGKRKKFDDDDLSKLKILEKQYYNLESSDPLKNIVEAIKEMYRIYV